MTDMTPEFSRWEYQNIALAAVAQSAALVHRIATRGDAPDADLAACINPLLVLDPDSVADVYPQVADLSLGLRTVQSIFSSERNSENSEVVRYTLGMLLLRNRLTADQDMQRRIRERLALIEPLPGAAEVAQEHSPDFEQSQQERVFRQLAGLYQDTISTLSYRIQVQGKVEYLKDEAVANRIRALLLAGIRSAVLWYQLGGRRWRLLLYRKRIHESAGNIRRKILSSI